MANALNTPDVARLRRMLETARQQADTAHHARAWLAREKDQWSRISHEGTLRTAAELLNSMSIMAHEIADAVPGQRSSDDMGVLVSTDPLAGLTRALAYAIGAYAAHAINLAVDAGLTLEF